MSEVPVPEVGSPQANAPAPQGREGGPSSKAGLLAGLAGVLLIVGSYLPWVTIGGGTLNISGMSARWGSFTLVAGLALLGIAAQFATVPFVTRSLTRPLAMAGATLGVLSLGLALYVGLALRDDIANSQIKIPSDPSAKTQTYGVTLDDNRSFEEFFKIGTGAGVYTAALGGLLGAVGAGLALRRNETD